MNLLEGVPSSLEMLMQCRTFSVVSCPLWDGYVCFFLTLIGAVLAVYRFVRVVERTDWGQPITAESLTFWTVLAFNSILFLLRGVLEVTLDDLSATLFVAFMTNSFCFLILSRCAIMLLESMRMPWMKVSKVFNWVLLAGNGLCTFLIVLNFVLRLDTSDKFNEFNTALQFTLFFGIRLYTGIHLLLAFVLNQSVSRYMPARYLKLVKALLCFLIVPTMLNIVLQYPFLGQKWWLMWIQLSILKRLRYYGFLDWFSGAFTSMGDLCGIGVLMYFMGDVAFVEKKKTSATTVLGADLTHNIVP